MEFLRLSAGKLPCDLTRMFSASNPKFIRAMCRAVFDWKGLQSNASLIRIHGAKDRVIPCPPSIERPIDGGHLIAMTHAAACLEQIEKSLSPDSTRSSAPR